AGWRTDPEYMVVADSTRFPLLDAAAAHLDQLVFREAARVVPESVRYLCVLRRACAAMANLRPASAAIYRLRRHHALNAAHRRHRELQLLQSADDRAGRNAA